LDETRKASKIAAKTPKKYLCSKSFFAAIAAFPQLAKKRLRKMKVCSSRAICTTAAASAAISSASPKKTRF
jgi:hypothetical protein